MSNRPKKYQWCPSCYATLGVNVSLVKVQGKKYTYECPECKMRVYPDRIARNLNSKVFKNRLTKILHTDIDVWANEAQESFKP